MDDFPDPGIPTRMIERRDDAAGAAAEGRSRAAVPAAAVKALAVLRCTAAEGSTPRPGSEDPHKPMLRRPAVLLAALVLVLVLAGLLWVGAFPPEVTPAPVERPVPTDRFQPR